MAGNFSRRTGKPRHARPLKRKVGKRGYRLHDERIAYSGGHGSMRTIKFELLNADDSRDQITRGAGLQKAVADAIHSDYLHLYGAMNFDDFLADPNRESFLTFWVEAVRLGFIFSKQSHAANDFSSGRISSVFAEIPEEIRKKLNQYEWCEWAKAGTPKSNDPVKMRNQILRLYNDPEAVDEDIVTAFANNNKDKFSPFKVEKLPDDNFPKINGKNVSWHCDPSFIEVDGKNKTEILDNVVKQLKEKLGVDKLRKDDQLSHFLALYELNQGLMFGFMGNFFSFIKQGDFANYLVQVKNFFGYDDEKIVVIRERLEKLALVVKDIPAKPKLVKTWASYNTDFGGKLESWYSNRIVKGDTAREQLAPLREILTQIREKLPVDNEIREGILAETLEFLGDENREFSREFTEELESYLATLRTELNFAKQQDEEIEKRLKEIREKITDKETGEITERAVNWQKILGRHIQSAPLFYGENKRQLWAEIRELKSLIREQIGKLREVLGDENFADAEISDRQIDQLANLYARIREDGNTKVLARLGEISGALDLDFSRRNARARFFLSGYEKSKNYYKNLLTNDGKNKSEKNEYVEFNRLSMREILKIANFSELFFDVETAPQNDNILRDAVALSKVILSAKVQQNPAEEQRKLVLAHSLLSGYAALISRAEFISRSAVQATNGEQTKLVARNGRYFYEFDEQNFTEFASVFPTEIRENDAMIEPKKSAKIPALAVASSRYQTQFLDWFAREDFAKKRKTELSFNGGFSIADYAVKLDWSGEIPAVRETEAPRVYISQPFTIEPPEHAEFDAGKIKNRYIGVDLGEYSLAWSLIEADGKNVKLLESGFIEDYQQQTIKNYVKNWRESQARQTFTSPDTKLLRIRESLIGSYRAELESLALAKHARLSFEYEVSGFETGGNRVAKVYDSIKQGVIRRDENKIVNEHAWGKNEKPKGLAKESEFWAEMKDNYAKIFGFETTAAWTSRYCTKCRYVASKENLERDFPELKFYGDVRPDLGKSEQAKKVRETLGAAKFAKFRDENKSSIAFYVCPKCGHVTDADKQASFNIAVRGYVKDRPDLFADAEDVDKKSGKWKKLSKEILADAENSLEFAPVEL